MRKTITLVGRTNVGKSSIFNRLIGSNKAIVSDYEGLTRDRKISTIDKNGISLDLIDTGGFSPLRKINLKTLSFTKLMKQLIALI